MTIKFRLATHIVFVTSVLGFSGCDGGAAPEEYGSIQSALEQCVLQAPAITEVREESPGAVAAGISKIYHVTVRNSNSAGCAPATLTFTPDSFMFFSTVVQPSTISGVSSGSTASFRAVVTSDASLPEGVTNIGFTIISTGPVGGATTVRGSLRYEIDFDNPVGCNRQVPQVEVSPSSPPPVAGGTPVLYHVTVRNVDNRECGPDTFSLSMSFTRFIFPTFGPPLSIGANGSGVIDVTITSAAGGVLPGVHDIGLLVTGERHTLSGGLAGSGNLRYTTL